MTYNNRKVQKHNFSHLGYKIHTQYTVTYDTPDIDKLKSSIFVNIIHSLDALHLSLIVKSIKHNNFLTIHDALLFNATENLAEVIRIAAATFFSIHNQHEALKCIILAASKRARSTETYKSILYELEISPPKLVEEKMRLMA